MWDWGHAVMLWLIVDFNECSQHKIIKGKHIYSDQIHAEFTVNSFGLDINELHFKLKTLPLFRSLSPPAPNSCKDHLLSYSSLGNTAIGVLSQRNLNFIPEKETQLTVSFLRHAEQGLHCIGSCLWVTTFRMTHKLASLVGIYLLFSCGNSRK